MAYRRREVYVLLAEMVLCILKFKADAQLDDAQTAIEKLNLYDPNWRDGFPLSVNDNQTVGLIERLVNSSTKCNAVKKTCRRNKPMPFTRSVV